MNTKHGAWLKSDPIQHIAELALQHRYTHVWCFAEPGEIPASHDEWSIQAYKKRSGAVRMVSVWKRGLGHVNIIFVNNTRWGEGAFKDVTPAQALDAINYMERVLGVPITGSPGSSGWGLLKKLHPEWIEDIPVNLADLHFIPQAGPDLIWQHAAMREGRGLPRRGRYVHKWDRRSAYPYVATTNDYGKGTPEHLEGEAANWASIHEKGHPQEVGVWRCSIQYDGSTYNPDMPPVLGEELGTHAGSDAWLAGPIIRMLRAFGHEVTVHEGYVFPERHDLLKKWANFLIDARRESTNEIAAKGFKQIANTTIGYTAFKHFEDDEEEKRRPDIRLQTVARQREILRHNIQKVYDETGQAPIMVYMDAVYYLTDEPVLMFSSYAQRENMPGGMRYEGRIELTPDVEAMFERKLNVVDRLEFLNKIGWTK